MFADILNVIIQWVTDYPLWSGAIIFLVAMLESLAIIGVVVPGVAIMFAIGTLISNGTLDMFTTTLWAAAGASVGDGLSFALGKHYKDKIHTIPWFKKRPDVLNKGHVFFEKYGVLSILIGRFVGPIRAVIPLVAGILDMPLKQYLPINIIASILWAPAYLFPGLIFGNTLFSTPSSLSENWPIWLVIAVLIVLLAKFIHKKPKSD
ncbi:MAG: phosphoesterase PA-phosphatase [Cycloclasticus sp. symbiont of Poecilosclerida sp. N]|nr:MAG: phosphoesterase PA-phosphatase [Cycloclasticus sp. symbiont of Poecilosclerida sp. N]